MKNSIGKRTDLSTHKVHHGVHNNDVRGRKSVFERQRETRGETKKRITRIINVSAKKSYENKILTRQNKVEKKLYFFFFQIGRKTIHIRLEMDFVHGTMRGSRKTNATRKRPKERKH